MNLLERSKERSPTFFFFFFLQGREEELVLWSTPRVYSRHRLFFDIVWECTLHKTPSWYRAEVAEKGKESPWAGTLRVLYNEDTGISEI